MGFLAALVLTGGVGMSLQHGWRDLWSSNTHLSYWPTRDMRRTVVLNPQKGVTRGPDSLSLPVTGRPDFLVPGTFELNRAAVTAALENPVPADDSSLARGGRTFAKLCTPCHGKSMAGDGPVAASFLPPPDLLAATTRGRSDGYIYSYIRYGGAVMPKYGQAASPIDAWNLVNYLRQQQKAHPR
jgi:mono/diheme cytochrome c family protein